MFMSCKCKTRLSFYYFKILTNFTCLYVDKNKDKDRDKLNKTAYLRIGPNDLTNIKDLKLEPDEIMISFDVDSLLVDSPFTQRRKAIYIYIYYP